MAGFFYMQIHPIFKIREEPTPEIIELLDNTILGTEGAQYRHLDTREKISECDNPLFLSMERSKRVLGNITFCRRGKHWYIRYFAFDQHLRSAGKTRSNKTSENFLKKQVDDIFQLAFEGEFGQSVDTFYAYVDPKNVRSLWMSEQFGFERISTVATQSFSRAKPSESNRVKKVEDWPKIEQRVQSHFSEYQYFFEAQTKKPPHYILYDESGNILASAKTTKAVWEINRLPGNWGSLLVKLIPYIPVINKIVNPKRHTFIVVEAVIAKNNDPKLVEELFSAILQQEKLNLIFWWIDTKDILYSSIRKRMKWGPMKRLMGVPEAYVMAKKNPKFGSIETNKPVYTVGLDFI